MKILVGCEESQTITIELRKLGHEAYSCDIQECSGGHPEWHIINDVIEIAYKEKWDMMIAHPPCTYLCNSGVRWLDIRNGKPTWIERYNKTLEASKFFKLLLNAPMHRIAIENPIPHKYGELPKYTQIIQPWQFGHGETKSTCLWLKNLPKLIPTNIVNGRDQNIWKTGPSNDRSKIRSKTYPGIAKAIAEQWTNYNWIYHKENIIL